MVSRDAALRVVGRLVVAVAGIGLQELLELEHRREDRLDRREERLRRREERLRSRAGSPLAGSQGSRKAGG
jgi:hypothetical protein